MNYFALFLFAFTTVSVTAMPPTVRHYKSSREAFNGPDRTITWRPWHQSPDGHFRFRTGDRYLGGQVWEHYLAFELQQTWIKAIKLSMIRLANEDIREEVVIRPGLRYAILKVTNDTMTAHKGVWSWTAQGPWCALINTRRCAYRFLFPVSHDFLPEAEERSVTVSPALAKKRLAGMKRRKPKTLIIVFTNAVDASWTRYSHGCSAMS